VRINRKSYRRFWFRPPFGLVVGVARQARTNARLGALRPTVCVVTAVAASLKMPIAGELVDRMAGRTNRARCLPLRHLPMHAGCSYSEPLSRCPQSDRLGQTTQTALRGRADGCHWYAATRRGAGSASDQVQRIAGGPTDPSRSSETGPNRAVSGRCSRAATSGTTRRLASSSLTALVRGRVHAQPW